MSVELPPLPEPVRTSSDQAYLGYTADQTREYGRACARAAYERAAQECNNADKSTHPADLADRIRALKEGA